jgi:transposase InsO family protein
MGGMGLQAIYPQSRTTVAAPGHKIYPYLLRNLNITHPNQVWSSDITYIPMQRGFMYLVAIIDWYSRYVLAWQLSNTLDGRFCLQALAQSLTHSTPEIFNTDQGAQFTAQAFTERLEDANVRVSMDGWGRALDNVFVERLWRSVKYENIDQSQHFLYNTSDPKQKGREGFVKTDPSRLSVSGPTLAHTASDYTYRIAIQHDLQRPVRFDKPEGLLHTCAPIPGHR